MRVLQLHTRYRQRGGEDTVVEAEAKVLRQAGHVVEQYFSTNPSSNVTAIGALVMSPWNPASARQLTRALAHFRPDVVHIHNTWYAMSPSVVKACRDAGVPIVMTLHNYRLTCANGLLFRDGKPCELCVGSHPWHAVRYGCYRDSRVQSIPAAATIALHRRIKTWAKDVDRFIVMSEMQRDIMARAGLPNDRITIKRHFVSDPGPRAKPPSVSNQVLFVGRLSMEKGIKLLLDAWKAADLTEMELLIIGDGPLKSLVVAEGKHRVRTLGRLPAPRVIDLMIGSRALVMPSMLYETMGMVVLEAFASGLPTIVSDIGAPNDLVRESLGGDWVFESGQYQDLSRAIRSLGDPAFCDEGGRRARSCFEQTLNDSSAAAELCNVYKSAQKTSSN